ncbi:MAG: FmdB family transcriptional regulator [Micromonosporaceae bacterium]|nr:FmdB family transcriptional regulator [Micromonosporaceae bacterium]
MPTYQYACTACDHRLEAVQSFADDPLTTCPVCEGGLRKLFGSVGIVFKGSGFYRTDSRAAANGKAKADGDGGASGGKSGEAGSKDKAPVGSGAASSSSSDSSSSGSSDSSGSSSSSGSSTSPTSGS